MPRKFQDGQWRYRKTSFNLKAHSMAPLPAHALMSFRKAGALFPEAFRPTLATLYRYANVGCRGRKLKTVRIGGRRFTSVEYVAEFLAPDDGPDPLAGLESTLRGPAAGAGEQVLPCK